MLTKYILRFSILLAAPWLWVSTVSAGWSWEIAANKEPTINGGSGARIGSFDAALKAVREGNDDEALRLIRDASARLPGWHPIRLELARLQFAANLPIKARRTLERAAVEYPADPRVFAMFGSFALSEGRYSDARLNGEKAWLLIEKAQLDADSTRSVRSEVSALLATVAEGHDDWDSARAHLRAWLDQDPTNPAARQRLGRALFWLGRRDEAYQELLRSAKDDPKLSPAAVPMALLFVQAGNDAKAEEWFAYASKVDPESAGVRLTWARWRLDKGRASEARLLVEEAAKLDPKSKEVESIRGLVAWQLRDLASAERIFEALHREAPSEAGYAALLTLAMVEQESSEKRSLGLQMAEVNARKYPRGLDILAALGRAHARSGHRDEAERLYRDAIAGAGGQATPTLAYFLAEVLAEKGRIDDARSLLTQATASPVAYAYQNEARSLLASLKEKSSALPNP